MIFLPVAFSCSNTHVMPLERSRLVWNRCRPWSSIVQLAFLNMTGTWHGNFPNGAMTVSYSSVLSVNNRDLCQSGWTSCSKMMSGE